MKIMLEEHLREVASPANLAINDQIQAFREQCRQSGCDRPYHHFAFGQSPFPPPPCVVAALAANADKHDYLPTAGLPDLREAVADYHARHFGLSTTAARVLTGPGSKELIAAILAVLKGTVIVPTPSWVSYLPQARILKKAVVPLRTRWEDDLKVTPGRLEDYSRRLPQGQKVIILNHPHNPTGVTYSGDELSELADVCRRNQIVVISDEIYASTQFQPERFDSMMRFYPEGTIVTGGLSKDRSSGGYRFGVALFPEEPAELFQDVLKIAGSTYSCVAAPIQYAALAAYEKSEEVDAYVRDCAGLNALVGRKTGALFHSIPGARTRAPGGAFYLYVDFNELKEQFEKLDLATSAGVAQDLLHVEHTAVLPGKALLLADDDISFRCSYVDYEGASALEAFRSKPPQGPEEEDAFYERHCPLLLDGAAYVRRYIEQIREGKRPQHA